MATTSLSDGQNLRKGGCAAWTPTGRRKVFIVQHPADKSKFILQVKAELRASGHGGKKTVRSTDEDCPGAPGFLGCYRLKQWATREAAAAAIDHFRGWVDNGRRKQTTAAAVGRARSAAEAAAIEVGEALPHRYSRRLNVSTQVQSAFLALARR